MKTHLLPLFFFMSSGYIYSQVGVNTVTPKATLDVVSKNIDGSTPEGIIAPRLTGDQIKAADMQYGSAQKGAIVYATAAVGTISSKTINVTSEGYYYFDGNIWQKIGRSSEIISVTSIVDPNILGYVPSTTASASTAPSSTTAGSTLVTLIGTTTTYSGNGHSYAVYATTSPVISWYDAYNAAKSHGRISCYFHY